MSQPSRPAKRMELKSTEDVANENGVTLLAYGSPGIGKTYAIRTLPNPVVASSESGLLSLKDTSIPYQPIESKRQLIEFYEDLKSGDHDFEAVALDSITKMATMILQEEMEATKDGRAAYGNMADSVRELFDKFIELPMHVYFSAKLTSWEENGETIRGPAFPGNQLVRGRPVAHQFDHVLAFVRHKGERKILTTARNGYQAKVRDPEGVIDDLESPDLGDICRRLSDS